MRHSTIGFKLNSNDMDKNEVFKKDSNGDVTWNFEVRLVQITKFGKTDQSLNIASSSPYQYYTPYLVQLCFT